MTKGTRRMTGSRLLGEELRRLRGARRLEDVVAFSRGEAAALGAKPLSIAALSDIENGVYLPRLETLVMLCVVYRVPPSRFVARMLEDRLVAGHEIPDDPAALEEQAVAALRDARWPRALALVVAGIRRAAEGLDRLRWRLRHAQVLTNLGSLDDALRELQDALDSPALPADWRGRVHLEIANASSRAGHVTTAALHCDAALALVSDATPRTFRQRVLQTSIALTIRRHAAGSASERDLHQALRLTSQAHELLEAGDDAARLAVETYRAQLHEALGNRTYAHELYRRLEKDCERAGNSHVTTCVLVSHAELLIATGRPAEARARLERAAQLAADSQAVDHAFEAHYLLMGCAQSASEKELHRRRCQRFLAQASVHTPRMRAFAGGGAA